MPHSNALRPKCRPLPPPPGYAPRNPRSTALYQAVQQNRYAAFNALADTCLPAYVERHFDAYLRCGIHDCDFLRLRCDACCQDLLVPFSCKKRGVCPSCSARRASDTGVHLTDHVLPQVPYRQWVFTLPYRLRCLLSRNPRLLTRVLQACIRALFAVARKRAKAAGLNARNPGAITFIQRFGSALQLNVHFHVVMADGLFDEDGSFQHLPSLHDEDVEHVLSKTIRNIVRTCGESIPGGDETEPSALSLLDGQALVPLSSSSRAYQPPEYKPLTAREQGFTLHTATRVAASNPRGLFRLCAYGARGAIASSRLSRLPSGTFAYERKRPLSDGRKILGWTGEQLVSKLVPPPVSENRSAPLRESHPLSRGVRAEGKAEGTGRGAGT